MDFTREPVIETIITPREGCKIVIRSSKGISQEEYFLDAVEVVSFGHALFFRSLEKPKSFLLPIADYEVLEVRETRMVLKHGVGGKAIKIAGGREVIKPPKMPTAREPVREPVREEEGEAEPKIEKKRERRRRTRRRGRDNGVEESIEGENLPMEESTEKLEGEESTENSSHAKSEVVAAPKPAPAKLFPAPTTLISDTIQRYRQDEHFKEVFYPPKEEGKSEEHPIVSSEEGADSDDKPAEVTPNLETHYALEPESLWDFIEEASPSLEEEPIEEVNPSLKEDPN